MEGHNVNDTAPLVIEDKQGNRYLISAQPPVDLSRHIKAEAIHTPGDYAAFIANLPERNQVKLKQTLTRNSHRTPQSRLCQGEVKVFKFARDQVLPESLNGSDPSDTPDAPIGTVKALINGRNGSQSGTADSLTRSTADTRTVTPASSGSSLSKQAAKRPTTTHATTESGPADHQPADKAATADTPCEGEPISMISGEELLPLTDFTLPGPIPFHWERTYRSSNPADYGLGYGWTHPLCECLRIDGGFVYYQTLEGRTVRFVQPAIGHSRRNRNEKMTLLRQSEHCYHLLQNREPRKVFRADGVHPHLPMVELRDPFNNIISIDYTYGLPHKLITSWGRVLSFRHDDHGHITEIRSLPDQQEASLLARYRYDEQQDLVEAQGQSGCSELYRYNNHVILQRTTPAGISYLFEWDEHTPNARCQRQWADNGAYDYRFKWQPNRKISYATDGNGQIREYHFNEHGKVVKEVDPEGGVTRRLYDSYGHLCSETLPEGQTTFYRYDQLGNVTRITNALNHSTLIRYNAAGLPVLITDTLGHQWLRRYSDRGLLVENRDPQGNIWRYEYNDKGQLETLTDPEGGKRRLQWNSQFELVQETNADGLSLHYGYDHWSRVNRITDAAGRTRSFEYNNAGRITQITDADGNVTRFTYNEAGQVTQITDPGGRSTQYRYGGFAQVEERIDASGQRLRYRYDNERNLIGLINEKGEEYRLKYDGNERLIEEIGFDGRRQGYRYNASGHLTEHRDMDVITQFQRDPLGRLLRKSNNSGDVAEFQYDAAGRLTAANNDAAFVRFQYDACGRLLNEHFHTPGSVGSGSHSLQHQYDQRGWRIGTSSADQHVRWQHTPGGQLYGVDHNGRPVIRCEYDQTGRLRQRIQGSLISQFDYDPMGRLTRQRVNRQAGNDTVIQRDYKYTAAGNLAQIEDLLRGLTHYHYDPKDQLSRVEGAVREAFEFDPAGNLLKKTEGEARYAQGNQLRLYGERCFHYDARGNLVQEQRGKQQSPVAIYQYNGWNQLVRVEKDGFKTHYQYDALGRRISKAVTHIQTRQQKKTSFCWNGDVLWSETSHTPKGISSQHYLFEPNSFRPLALIKDDKIHHYHLDHLGTPQEITDDTGVIVWQAQYKAYGQLAGFAEKPGVSNPLRFQGQYFDSETGLHYNRHRYYDPDVGRFIHQDPAGLLGGINSYRYAPNPVGWVDPLGLTCKENAWNTFQTRSKGAFRNSSQAAIGYGLWQNQDWSALEALLPPNSWPPNRGAIQSEPVTIPSNQIIDRYGGWSDAAGFHDSGTFISPVGESFPSRALPAKALEKPYRKYKVVKPIPAEKATAIPWFGQPGLGTQYELPAGIDDMISAGYLVPV